MYKEDKSVIAIVTIVIIGLLIFTGLLVWENHISEKMKFEQPKYFIEFKGRTYELKEVE